MAKAKRPSVIQMRAERKLDKRAQEVIAACDGIDSRLLTPPQQAFLRAALKLRYWSQVAGSRADDTVIFAALLGPAKREDTA